MNFGLSKGMFWLVALMLTTANFIAVLNMTIANVSVPNIAGSLGATTSQGTWVITSYAVGEAITVPLTGWLAMRFGAVRVFVGAMITFGIFSFLCGMANSIRKSYSLQRTSNMPLKHFDLVLWIFCSNPLIRKNCKKSSKSSSKSSTKTTM